jgi:acyl carrier protein
VVAEQILFLWALSDAEPEIVDTAQIQANFFELVYLVQALQNREPPIAIHVLTQPVHAVAGETALWPGQAVLGGILRVLPQELPHVTARHYDVAPPTTRDWRQSRLLTSLLADMADRNGPPLTAWRGTRRYLPDEVPVTLPEAGEWPMLRKRGCYLIAAEPVHFARALGRFLVEQWQARVVFLRPRGSAGPEPELDFEALTLDVDFGDRRAVAEALVRVGTEQGDIKGVFHLHEVFGGSTLRAKKPADSAAVFAAKIAATLGFCDFFSNLGLDFMVVNSSLSATLGGVGQADYSAANAFVETLAVAERDLPIQTIAWPMWRHQLPREDIQHTGYARVVDVLERLAVDEASALECLERALAFGADNLLVSMVDLATFQREIATSSSTEPAGVRALRSRPELSTARVAPGTDLEKMLVAIWEEILGISGLGIRDSFFELGGDSLMASVVATRLQEKLAVDVPLREMLAEPTIAHLSAMVEASRKQAEREKDEMASLLDRLEDMSAEEVARILEQHEDS